MVFPPFDTHSSTGFTEVIKPETASRSCISSGEVSSNSGQGIFGIFDGQTLSSAVLIRFIEKTSGGLVFKSGGGLTNRSDPKKEYEELISKIYVPVF